MADRRGSAVFFGRVVVAGLLLAGAGVAAGQESPPVRAEERVTAVDLLVGFETGKDGRPLAPPANLRLSELSVRLGGRAVPLVGLEPADGAGAEPWRLAVYFDLPLASSRTVRWAASVLAERAAELVELGAVEVVVADPEPGVVLAAGRDAELLDQALSGIFVRGRGEDRLVRRREEFLLAEGDPAGPPPETARQAAVAEQRLVRERQDELASWLIEQTGNDTPRRALLLVSDGFDLAPESFYGGAGADSGGAEGGGSDGVGAGGAATGGVGSPATVDLTPDTETLARTLAAYGWVVAPLAPPEAVRGAKRFGVRWSPRPHLIASFTLRTLAVWLDRNRNPKKAGALTELGLALEAQGELEEAEDAFRRAVYHYYDHPKTAGRQAAALVHLGRVLERRGESLEAREALRSAVAFDPTLAAAYPFTAAALTDPLAPLALLAAETAGRTVEDRPSLDDLLDSLAGRVRLTFQVSGPPDGELHELALELDRAVRPVYPRWARSGTLPSVGALRLRRLLAGRAEEGPLPVEVSCLRATAERGGDSGRTGRLRLRLATAAVPPPVGAAGARGSAGSGLRLTWGTRGPATETAVHQRPLRPEELAAGSLELALPLPAGHVWVAAVVEEIATGAWGGEVCELR